MNNDLTPNVTRESDKFMLRFPAGMRDRIAAEAKKSNRSMNAEIVARLQQTLDQGAPGGLTQETAERLSVQMAALMDKLGGK